MKRLPKTAAVLAAVLVLLAGCPQLGHDDPPAAEHEDCDLEDFVNREPDCGYTRPVPTPTTPKAVHHKSGQLRPDQPTRHTPRQPAARPNPISRR